MMKNKQTNVHTYIHTDHNYVAQSKEREMETTYPSIGIVLGAFL